MVRRKFWWFEKVDGEVFIMCDPSRSPGAGGGKRIAQTSGKPCSSVRRLSVYEPERSPGTSTTSGNADSVDNIKVYFTSLSDKPRLLSSRQFLWNLNSFCKLFRPQPNSVSPIYDFVELYKVHTSDVDGSMCMSTSEDDASLDASKVYNFDSDADDDQSQTQLPSQSILTGHPMKRKRSNIAVPALMKKRQATSSQAKQLSASEQFKKEAQDAHLGHVKISIGNLELGKQIRQVRDSFVKGLQQQMEQFSNSAYQPLCVLTKTLTRKELFSDANANGYKYAVIGGQHSFLAAKSMNQLHPETELFQSRWCTVYFGDISSEAQLYLANLHNVINGYRHDMTFRDKVKMCHTMKEEATVVNKSKWKEDCSAILNEDPDSHLMRIVTFLSSMEDNLFQKVDTVLAMHEDGELKGQKIKAKDNSRGVVQVHPYIFRDLPSIQTQATMELFTQLSMRQITISEMKTEAAVLKKLQRIQQVVVDFTDSTSWEDAAERFPGHTSREVLSQFLNVSLASKVPKSLQHFCRMLRKTEAGSEEADHHQECQHLGRDGTIGFHVEADAARFTFVGVKEVATNFSGFNLGIMCMPKDWNADNLRSFLVSCSATNLSANLTEFSVVVICPVSAVGMVFELMHETEQFEYVCRSFFHVPKEKSDEPLTPSVYGLVLAFTKRPKKVTWALGGHSDNFIDCPVSKRFRSADGEVVEAMPLHIYREVILTLSSPKQWVLDGCCGTGTGLIASVQEGRNCVAMDSNQVMLQHLKARCHTELEIKTGRRSQQDESSIDHSVTDSEIEALRFVESEDQSLSL